MKTYQAAESVTFGHPDKLCDQIADAILDEHLLQDPKARVAVEVLATAGFLLIAGEVTSKAKVNAGAVAKRVMREVGYNPVDFKVQVKLHEQSPDIALGVDCALETRSAALPSTTLGAGDQSIVYGYATDETPELLPLPQVLARNLTRTLEQVREEGTVTGILPDGKALVVIEYEEGKAKRIHSVVVSAQHRAEVDLPSFRSEIKRFVIEPVLKGQLPYEDADLYINPTGSFVLGGPAADTGLTGRKVAVDTYGGLARHGGGAFSGKDPTKVDRSGAYMARLIAQSVVIAGFASRCEVCIAYAIGKAEPLFFNVDCFGTETLPLKDIKDKAQDLFPMSVSSMIEFLRLSLGGYQALSIRGHFGNGLDPWENSLYGFRLRTRTGGPT